MKLPQAGGGGSNAKKILSIPFFPSFGPGNTGAEYEYILYYPAFGVMGFFEVPIPTQYAKKFIETFKNEQNPHVITAASGGASATYGTNGLLTLATGGGGTGEVSVKFKQVANDVAGLLLLNLLWDSSTLNIATGDMELAYGITNGTTLPTNATVTEGMWVYVDVTSGTPTVYACVANGTNVTAVDITSAINNIATMNQIVIRVTSASGSLTSVSFYQYDPARGGALLTTITTNLPTANLPNGDQLWRMWLKEGDTNNRQLTLNYAEYVTQ